MKIIPQRVLDRVLADVPIIQPNGCHYSWRSLGSHGYPQVAWALGVGKPYRMDATTVARALWTAHHGPIENDLTIEHAICKDRKCVNVEHFELWTLEDNARDGSLRQKSTFKGRYAHLRPGYQAALQAITTSGGR